MAAKKQTKKKAMGEIVEQEQLEQVENIPVAENDIQKEPVEVVEETSPVEEVSAPSEESATESVVEELIMDEKPEIIEEPKAEESTEDPIIVKEESVVIEEEEVSIKEPADKEEDKGDSIRKGSVNNYLLGYYASRKKTGKIRRPMPNGRIFSDRIY